MVPAPMRIAMVDPADAVAQQGQVEQRDVDPSFDRDEGHAGNHGFREQPSVATDVQPHVLPWLNARMSGARVRATRTVPA